MTPVTIQSAFAVANSDIANVSQPKKVLTMNAIHTTNTDLHWKVLTIKRPGLVPDLPPGKEELRDLVQSLNLGPIWQASDSLSPRAPGSARRPFLKFAPEPS